MLPSITGDCHPDINILCLLWAGPGPCLSITGQWGLQSHLLPSLLLDLGRNWQCIKSKFHATWGHHITQSKEHLRNRGEVPTTLMNTGGAGEQRGGWRPREEGRQEG